MSSSFRTRWRRASPALSSPQCKRPRCIDLPTGRPKTLPPTIYTFALSRRSVRENGRRNGASRRSAFSVGRSSVIRITDLRLLQRRFATRHFITLAGLTTRVPTAVRASISLVGRLGLLVATPMSSALLPACLATSEKTLAQLSHLSTVPLNSTRALLWVGNGAAG